MEMSVGSLVITEAGSVVLITAPNSQGELQGNGVVPTFDGGVVVRSKVAAVGSYARIPTAQGKRVAGHISEVLRLLENSGADLTTPAERPLNSLSPMERIERLERENAQLRAGAAK